MDINSRYKLTDTATQLFAEKGFFAVSIREIAEAAGVNSALISYYFGSKEGLYQAVLEEQFYPLRQALKFDDDITQLSSGERIGMYAKAIAEVHKQCPYLIRFMYSELTNPTACFEAVVKKHISQLYKFLIDAFSDGIETGDFESSLHPGYAAVALAGIMNFYFIVKPLAGEFLPQSEQQAEEYLTQALKIFLSGVRGGK